MRLELADERGRVVSSVHGSSRRSQCAASVGVSDGVKGLEKQLDVGDAEHGEHVGELDLSPRVGLQLLERAEGVAEAARGMAREHRHGLRADRDRPRPSPCA